MTRMRKKEVVAGVGKGSGKKRMKYVNQNRNGNMETGVRKGKRKLNIREEWRIQ